MNDEIFRMPKKLINFDEKLTLDRYENEVVIHIDHEYDPESDLAGE